MPRKGERVPIQESHDIPSRGKVYPEGTVPSEFTLRAMTTVEEKARLAGTGMNTIPDLISSCIVKPENFDAGILKMFDLRFLLFKLRTITYGPDYNITIECPSCGKATEVKVDLDKIPTNYIEDDDFTGIITVGPLPVCGDTLECILLSSSDYVEMEKEAKRIKAKSLDYVGDPSFILSYMKRIVKINGEEVKPFKIQKYIEEMNMRDLRYLDSKYDKATEGIGMDTDMVDTCPACGFEVKYSLPVNSEFFRPEYND